MFNIKFLQEEIVTDIPSIVTTVPSIETQPPAMVETFQPIETQPIETQPVLPAGTAPSSDSTEEIPIATESSLATTQNIAINTALPTQPTFTSAQAGSEIDAVQPTLSDTGFTTASGPLGSQAVPTQFGEIKTPSVGQEIDETTIIQTTAATIGGDAASNGPTSSSVGSSGVKTFYIFLDMSRYIFRVV